MKKRAIYDQYGYEGLTNGVPARPGKLLNFIMIDFEGFQGGYQFHGNAEDVFAHFFGGNNPFSGNIHKKIIIDFFGVHGSTKSFGKNFGGLHGMNADNAFNKEQAKAEPKLYDLNVSLEEVYNGTIKKFKVNQKVKLK